MLSYVYCSTFRIGYGYFRDWRSYEVIMPDRIGKEVVLSSLEGQQSIDGRNLKMYTLVFAIMHFVKCCLILFIEQ